MDYQKDGIRTHYHQMGRWKVGPTVVAENHKRRFQLAWELVESHRGLELDCCLEPRRWRALRMDVEMAAMGALLLEELHMDFEIRELVQVELWTMEEPWSTNCTYLELAVQLVAFRSHRHQRDLTALVVVQDWEQGAVRILLQARDP
jgi:hypothetical protein